MTGRFLAALLLVGSLGGCAIFKPDAEADKAKAPPAPPAVELEVQAPGPLKKLLETYLDLARLRTLAPGEPIEDTELRRLEASTPAQARGLLETEGYFAAEVAVERVGSNAAGTPRVRVSVQPGPRAVVSDVTWGMEGALEDASKAGDAHAAHARSRLQGTWLLPPGSPFRNPLWSDAKNAALAQLRAQGYAAAAWRETAARVDAEDNKVELALQADSGPLFRTGELRIEGLERQEEVTARNLANFPPGTPASEKLLLDYQERLQKAGLYDRATVLIDTDPATAEATPVTVRLHELPLQTAVIGLGVSANTGPRATFEHTHRRIFGLRATSRNKFELAQLRQAWDGEVRTHVQPGLYSNLLGGSIERLKSDTDTVTSTTLRVGRTQETERRDRLAFIELERADVRSALGHETSDALSLNYHITLRRVDNVLLPTRGYGLTVQTALGQARSNVTGSGPYVRLYGKYQYWKPFGNSWFAYGRIELGQVFVHNGVQIPDTQRFRAGGDESVRGYGYRTLGPVSAGVVESGNMLFTASAELAHPIVASLPDLLGAVFIDAGNAADRWQDLDPALGAGVGVRYRSPIGPLRVDVAYGERARAVRLHLTVGVQF
jgi:translocation and assembly module TamA